MHLKTILISLLLLQSIFVFSQQQNDKNTENVFWENVYFGGGLQLGISNVQTTIGISPSAIYEFSEQFAAGLSVSYLYSSIRYQDLSYHLYGGSALAMYNPIKEVQLSTEFEQLNVITVSHEDTNSYWQPAWYVGLGYGLGKHGAIGMRYNILYDKEKSIYDSAFTPFIRVYF